MKIEQLSLFDFMDDEKENTVQKKPEVTFKIGDRVKVKDLDELDHELTIDDVYYLTAYSGKEGKIMDIKKGKVTTYVVQLNHGELTYFYDKELILLD